MPQPFFQGTAILGGDYGELHEGLMHEMHKKMRDAKNFHFS
jgi:hypothetical protein